MFEISAQKPKEFKGTSERGNYHFLKQKVKVHSVDTDGDPTTGKYEQFVEPGEAYPAGFYLPHPDAFFVNRDQKGNDRPMIGKSPKLISLQDMKAWCEQRIADLTDAPRKAA